MSSRGSKVAFSLTPWYSEDMNFDDLLEVIAGILVFILLIFISYKIFTSKKNIHTKITLLIITILLDSLFWYFIQFVATFILAHTIPQNKIVNCIYLSEEDCKKRPDCSVGYVHNINGGSFCVYKSHSSK